jgi:transposase
MAPNLAFLTHALTLNFISSKLKGEEVPADHEAAKIARCCERTIRRHRANYLLYGSTKAPPNGGGRPATITPIMVAALHDQLALKSTMRLADMVIFLKNDFDVKVTPSSIQRALKKHGKWTEKATQNIAQERNPDLRDDFIRDLSFFRLNQLVIIDESGADRGIGTQRKGWAPRGKRPRQVKRFHRGRRFQILPAYTQDGVIHFMVYERSTDTEMFEAFIETLFAILRQMAKAEVCFGYE